MWRMRVRIPQEQFQFFERGKKMKITETIIAFGNKDLILCLVFAAIALISLIISLRKASSALTPFMMFIFLIISILMFIVMAFLPEQESYKAKITDYEEVQENGYIIIEHIKDDNYYIEKKSE